MSTGWIVRSESDTDRVLAEVNENGDETGNVRYEAKHGSAPFPAAPSIFLPYVEDVTEDEVPMFTSTDLGLVTPETVAAIMAQADAEEAESDGTPAHGTRQNALWFGGGALIVAVAEVLRQVLR